MYITSGTSVRHDVYYDYLDTRYSMNYRGAIVYTGSTSGNNYITRTKDTTTYYFEYISGTKFYTAKTFNVTFENTNVSTTIMQGICVYNNYLYISARKNSNGNNLIYKVTTPFPDHLKLKV